MSGEPGSGFLKKAEQTLATTGEVSRNEGQGTTPAILEAWRFSALGKPRNPTLCTEKAGGERSRASVA